MFDLQDYLPRDLSYYDKEIPVQKNWHERSKLDDFIDDKNIDDMIQERTSNLDDFTLERSSNIDDMIPERTSNLDDFPPEKRSILNDYTSERRYSLDDLMPLNGEETSALFNAWDKDDSAFFPNHRDIFHEELSFKRRVRRYTDLLYVNTTFLYRMNTGLWYLSVYNDAIAQTQVIMACNNNNKVYLRHVQ